MVFAAAGDFGLSWILEVITLFIIAFIIWKYVWSGGLNLRGMMSAREAHISTQLSAGDEARAQAEALVAEKRAALEAAKVEAASISAQSKTAAAEIVAEGERRAAEDYERLLQRADVEIESAISRVRAEVAAAASALIVDVVETVIAAELDGSSHHRLINEAIDATEAEEV